AGRHRAWRPARSDPARPASRRGRAVRRAWSLWSRRHRGRPRSEEHTSELQSRENLVCRLLLEKKKQAKKSIARARLTEEPLARRAIRPPLSPSPARPRRPSASIARPPPRPTLFPYTTLFRSPLAVIELGARRDQTLLDQRAEGDARFGALGACGLEGIGVARDRKSTRLNSSHVKISYAVFCLKKKNKQRRASRAPASPRSRSLAERSALLSRLLLRARVVLLLQSPAPHPALHSFPTRRSSDLRWPS